MSLATDTAYNILIVEDCAEDREIYKRYLSRSRSLTYVFSEAETVADGCERFAESLPDCVLLNNGLPDGNGFDFLERIASEFQPHQIRIVMLAGRRDVDLVVSAMKRGVMDFISKGRLTAQALCRTVYKAIEKGSLLRSLHQKEVEKDRLIDELRQALDQIKTLRGVVPICANCKRVRNDAGFWQQVEVYVRDHTDAQFSHGLCPECAEETLAEHRRFQR